MTATAKLARSESMLKRANSESTAPSIDDDRRRDSIVSRPNTRIPRRRITASHRKLVFSDPVAFRYLEEDESTIVIDRRKRLQGYQLYIVEQWACSRTHPTFIICTYTGDMSNSILVNILAVPNDESKWSRRLKIYLDAVAQFQAKEQETTYGTLMVTNLSGFPSALAVVAVPDGDVRKHREDFIVNENLKRMGCTGRAAMTLSDPSPSTIAKFHHLYQTSVAIHFKSSVIELVKICQTALVLYGKLDAIYTDGLLCDITERAIGQWWNDIGTDFHNIEPSDGILGPTTVSAMVGLLIGAYNRLKSAGTTVGKDPLDVGSMKRSIGSFQKMTKIDRTRRLDRETLDRLHRATAKTASGDSWTVPRAVKSTVAELSGKGGEMIMGVVGSRDKAGIAEVETLDIDRFAQLVPGARMKWLWQGKRLKSTLANEQQDDANDWVFGTDDDGKFLWRSGNHESTANKTEGDGDSGYHAGERKRGRIRDAVPILRSHNSRIHRNGDESAEPEGVTPDTAATRVSRDPTTPGPPDHHHSTSLDARWSLEKSLTDKIPFNLALAEEDAQSPVAKYNSRLVRGRSPTQQTATSHREQLRGIDRVVPESPGKGRARANMRTLKAEIEADRYQNFATEFDEQEPESRVLRHSKSARLVREVDSSSTWLLGIPRSLSYSAVEQSTIQPTDAVEEEITASETPNNSLSRQLAEGEAQAHELKQLTARMIQLEQSLLPYAHKEMLEAIELDEESRKYLSELNDIYYGKLEEYQILQATSRDLVAQEKSSLAEDVRRIEMLSNKLDYELNALQSRMQEVEDAAAEFEKNVAEIESRVMQLVNEQHSQGDGNEDDDHQVSWLQRLINLTGSLKF